MDEEFIEVVDEVECAVTRSGGDSDDSDDSDGSASDQLIDVADNTWLGGDDVEINPNTYIIGGNEYVIDDVKFAFLQHLYDLENGTESRLDPDEILTKVYDTVDNLASMRKHAADIICGFECFINQSLLQLERADKIKNIAAKIPPKPDFCSGSEVTSDQIYKYLSGFGITMNLTTGNTIDIKFTIGEYTPPVDDIPINNNPALSALYDKFKETELKSRKLLSEIAYIDNSLHLLIENINKLRKIIAVEI